MRENRARRRHYLPRREKKRGGSRLKKDPVAVPPHREGGEEGRGTVVLLRARGLAEDAKRVPSLGGKEGPLPRLS